MQKLTNMEAQRVINVLEDALDRIALLAHVPVGNPDTDLLMQLEEDGAHALASALGDQWSSEDQFLKARAKLASQAAKSRHRHSIAPVKQVSSEVVSKVHSSVRSVCRQLRRDPVAVERLTGWNSNEIGLGPQSDEFAAFHHCLSDLTAVTFTRLGTTVEEENNNKTLMHELVERERGAEEERDALASTLATQREERAREKAHVDAQEAKLRKELEHVAEVNAQEKAAIIQECGAARASALDSHTSNVARLEEEVEKLKKVLAETAEKHREAETGLRKKKEKAEREVAAKVAEYDEAMYKQRAETDELAALMASEKAELDLLEEHFAKVDANNAQSAEEDRALVEFRKKVEDAMSTIAKAATLTQKFHRGNAVRALLRAAKGGKKKGKKKK